MLLVVIIILVFISVLWSLWSLKGLLDNKKEAFWVKKDLSKGRVIYHKESSSLSE